MLIQDLAEVVTAEVVGSKGGKKRGIEQVERDKTKVVVERVKKDFFGRIVEEELDDGKKRRVDSSNSLKTQANVWVRFHEGYSNAVRKPVVFAELLGRM